MKKIISVAICIVASLSMLEAQNITGVVKGYESNDKTEALGFASVHWAGTSIGTTADDKGRFSIPMTKESKMLVASFIGYQSDTTKISGNKAVEFTLSPDGKNIESVVVKSRRRGNVVSNNMTAKTEIINYAGLCKMACCNLAESFENSAAVTVGYSDAISGARQIKMLGLSGIYTQMLDENRPVMRGLSSPFGLGYIPGMWLESIQVSKGVSSVINGTEALAGQINVEHRKPDNDKPLFVNAYFDSELRSELNVVSSLRLNNKLSTEILAHGSINPLRLDHNNDGFLDSPTSEQLNFGNRWLYIADNGIQMRAGLRFVREERKGGQMDFRSWDRGTTAAYGSQIDVKNFNAYYKIGIPLTGMEDPNHDHAEHEGEPHTEKSSNLAFVADYNFHQMDAYFGLKDYNGMENSVLFNAMYDVRFSAKNHLVLGASYRMDNYNELLFDQYSTGKTAGGAYMLNQKTFNLGRQESVAGIFGEYTFTLPDKLSVIVGLREDYNNLYKKWLFTPRGHIRWDIAPWITFRASGGRGFRSANMITDNIGMLATGRQIVIQPNINTLEDGWTYGGSFISTFPLFSDDKATLSLDFFRSQFTNQVIADQEQNSGQFILYNLDGVSYTNTFQVDFSVMPLERFSIFATYRWNDPKVTLRKFGEVQKPLVDKFKALLNLQYATRFNKWTFDVTAQLNGQSRLPVQDGVMQNIDYSPVYPMFFAQVTRKFRKVDVYLGCENIGNYRQKDPVIGWADPFSEQFNSSVVWGPLMGRKFYAGLRFTL